MLLKDFSFSVIRISCFVDKVLHIQYDEHLQFLIVFICNQYLVLQYRIWTKFTSDLLNAPFLFTLHMKNVNLAVISHHALKLFESSEKNYDFKI